MGHVMGRMPARTVAAVAAGIAVASLRKKSLRWQSTDRELSDVLAGDEVLRGAHLISTRAITIAASPVDVWPWIAQLGQGRGGFYSYDFLENVVGCHMHSADAVIDHWQEMKDVRGKAIGLTVLQLENGFESDKVLILSEQDVLGERITRAKPKKKKSDVFMAESANFGEGELVVHKEHGIGRFEGLVAVTVSGAAHDCLKIIYADDDKLFLPVENIEMVSRFGLEEEGV